MTPLGPLFLLFAARGDSGRRRRAGALERGAADAGHLVAGGWLGAQIGKRLPAGAIRAWTLFVTGATTVVFFWRAYG